MPQRVPWERIKYAYLHGSVRPTFVGLAEQFGVGESSIRKKCRADRWPAQREEIQAKAQAAVVKREVKSLAAELADWDKLHLDSAKLLYSKVIKFIQDWDGEVITTKTGTRPVLLPFDYNMLAETLTKLVKLERLVHGRETENTTVNLKGQLLVTMQQAQGVRERVIQNLGVTGGIIDHPALGNGNGHHDAEESA